jgi:hypothetical protein
MNAPMLAGFFGGWEIVLVLVAVLILFAGSLVFLALALLIVRLTRGKPNPPLPQNGPPRLT